VNVFERRASLQVSNKGGSPPVAIDSVVEPGTEPDGAKWLDLLVLALFAGRERDEGQWRALLSDTGWELVRLTDGLIEARRR
jgi:hypothetical protein